VRPASPGQYETEATNRDLRDVLLIATALIVMLFLIAVVLSAPGVVDFSSIDLGPED
jgi:hypothetical protein